MNIYYGFRLISAKKDQWTKKNMVYWAKFDDFSIFHPLRFRYANIGRQTVTLITVPHQFNSLCYIFVDYCMSKDQGCVCEKINVNYFVLLNFNSDLFKFVSTCISFIYFCTFTLFLRHPSRPGHPFWKCSQLSFSLFLARLSKTFGNHIERHKPEKCSLTCTYPNKVVMF